MKHFWAGFSKQAKIGDPSAAMKLTNAKSMNPMASNNLGKPKVSVKVPGTPAGKSLGGQHGVSSMRI